MMPASSSTDSNAPAAGPNAKQSDTSPANSDEYHSASEYPLQLDCRNFYNPGTNDLSEGSLQPRDHIVTFQSNPLQTGNVPVQSPVTSSPFNLSPTAAPFTPEATKPRNSVPEDLATPTMPTPARNSGARRPNKIPVKRFSYSTPRSSTLMHSTRPIYENHVPGIPSHWIPLYGACHGMFYDPITKLFHGDGSPRPTLERPDGSIRPIDTSTPLPGFKDHPEDALHILPLSVTDPIIRRQKESTNNHPNTVVHRYYCTCQNAWLSQRHNCRNDKREVEGLWDVAVPPAGFAACLRPGDVVPREEVTHDIKVRDLSYLSPAQRYAYEKGLPMPMPVLSELDDCADDKGSGMKLK
ncbi:MAG: hypothetical protein Q9222_001306 [Ikaeria aurantiellina]